MAQGNSLPHAPPSADPTEEFMSQSSPESSAPRHQK